MIVGKLLVVDGSSTKKLETASSLRYCRDHRGTDESVTACSLGSRLAGVQLLYATALHAGHNGDVIGEYRRCRRGAGSCSDITYFGDEIPWKLSVRI